VVEKSEFPRDLYYLLNSFPIQIPPLRTRRDNIPALVWQFVEKYAHGMNKRIKAIRPEQMAVLVHYDCGISRQ